MVTEPTVKTGYWRVNPETGERDWIEGNYTPKKPKTKPWWVEEVAKKVPQEVKPLVSFTELYETDVQWQKWSEEFSKTGKYPEFPAEEKWKPYYEQWLGKAKEWEVAHPQPAPTKPPVVDVTEISKLYNISPILFVPQEQLADLGLPPEQRTVQWKIPIEQYLTSEQAKWLGYDVPEGRLVKMTPSVEGEPSFYIMPELAKPPELDVKLVATLQNIYPERFEPTLGYGYSPDVAVESIQGWLQTDYKGFVDDLFARVGEDEGSVVLKQLGVTEEGILQTLDFEKQEERITNTIQAIFPELKTIDEFSDFKDRDPDLFIETLQTGGSTPEKRQLLSQIGYTPQDIDQIFGVQRLVLPVDGVRKLLTIDIDSQRAYDQTGQWIGTYNPVTREYESLPDEGILKDFVDSWHYAAAGLVRLGKTFLSRDLPNFLFRPSYAWERKLFGEEHANAVDAFNQEVRDTYRQVYAKNQRDFDDYLSKHPDIAPPPISEDVFDDWKNPTYWFYQVSQSAAFMGAILATEALVLLTTKNPALALTAGSTVVTTLMTPEAGDALLEAGATEAQAGQLALPLGAALGLIEVLGDIPYLKTFAPTVLRAFRKEAAKGISKQLVRNIAKSGVKTFTKTTALITFTETMEEDAQLILTNAAKKVFDENQDVFKGLVRTTFESAAIMLPFGLLGGLGASFHRVSPSQTQGLTDVELKAKGLVQDPKNPKNWYERLKGVVGEEKGAIVPGAEPGGITPEKPAPVTPEVTKIQPTYENLTTGQTLVDQAGDRWTITDISKEGRYTIKAQQMDLTRTTQFRELERFFQIEQPIAIPKAEAGMPEAGLQPSMIPSEVAGKEVRPAEEQLKLEQARKAAEEAPAEVKEAYKAQAEIEGLKATQQADPIANLRFQIGQRSVGKKGTEKRKVIPRMVSIDNIVDAEEKTFAFNDSFTLSQAKVIKPNTTFSEANKLPNGRIRADAVLDELAQKYTGGDVQAFIDRVNQIRREKARIRKHEETIKRQMIERPLPAVPELTTEQVAEQWQMMGQPRYNMVQINALVAPFAEYIMNRNTITAYELARQTLSLQRSERFNNLKAKLAEIQVQTGEVTEERARQIIQDTLSGKYWLEMTDYLQFITGELRDAHFAKVAHILKDYPAEYAGTITALVNALSGRPIPSVRPTPPPGGFKSVLWPQGASALDKLQYVFGKDTRHMKALEKMAEEKKPLEDVVEGVFHKIGEPAAPIPIDQETADYLRKLSDIPYGYKTLLEPPFEYPMVSDLRSPAELEYAKTKLKLGIDLVEGRITKDAYDIAVSEARSKVYPVPPITRYELPIEDGAKQIPLLPRPPMDNVIQVLKEIGMSPVDIGNFLRANKASFDFSFWRQQAPLIASHPISFVQANIEAWKALWSQKSTEASWLRITRDPIYQIYEECEAQGGDFLRPIVLKKGTAQWRGVEEYGYLTGERLIPKLTAKIPWVKLSARSFETGTNVHNWLIFKSYYASMLRLSGMYASGQKTLKVGEAFDIQKEMVDFSKSLANFTARGSLGKFAATAPELSGLFFAPRAAIGRILSVRDLINANPRVRLEAWKNAASFVGTFGGIVLLGAAIGWWEVEKDPRNAEYMSIRIGNTRIDPWGGYRQFLVFFTRAITQTGVSSVTGAEYKTDPINLIQTFIRGKASPLASLILDFWRGKNFVGEEVDVTNKAQWAERIAPFALWDIYEAYKDDPIHAMQVVIPAIIGAGVQTYTGDWKENWKKMGLLKFWNIPGLYYDTADWWADTASQFKGVDPTTLTPQKGFEPQVRAVAEALVINEHLGTLPSERLASLNADPTKGVTFGELRNLWSQRQALVDAGDDAEFVEDELQADGTYKKVTHKGDKAVTAFDKHEFTFRGVTIKGSQSYNGNFSQRQFALLNDYWLITDKKKQADFLKQHEAEIGVKPRDEYLRTHPKENAQLAVWGQVKILTKEAYNQFKAMVKELDIPDSALPKLTLPPEGSLETHFTYEEMVSAGTHGSWEAQLLLKKDYMKAKEAKVQSYVEWRTKEGESLKLSDTPIASLELKTIPLYHEIWNKLKKDTNPDWVGNLDDKIKDKDGLTARDRATAELKATKIGDETWYDVDRRIKALEKGTDEVPVDEKLVTAHVDYGKILFKSRIDEEQLKEGEEETLPVETKLFRVDNPEYDKWRQDKNIWDNPLKPIDQSRIPSWRIDVKYRKEDAEYQTILDKYPRRPPEEIAEAQAYMASHPDYRMDDRRRQGYGLSNSKTGVRLPIDQIENYVAFNELSQKGKRRERFVIDNPVFAKAMFAINGKDIYKTRPEDVPNVEYDNIYDQYKDTFDLIDRFKDADSPDYKDNTVKDANLMTERDRAVDALRFTTGSQTYSGVSIQNKVLTEFGLAEKRRDAYENFVPENYVNDYVAWRKTQSEGKPKDWAYWSGQTKGSEKWYEDDWFMKEHIDFYKNVYMNPKCNGGKQNEKWDFREVPPREVFAKYLGYLAIDKRLAKAREDYRARNKDLDAWGVIAFGWTPIKEKKRREALTPYERFIEEWVGIGGEIKEKLKALRE